MRTSQPLLTGRESVFAGEETLTGSTVLDFWRWAFSDLRQNNLRGVFCEWLVAQLLDIDCTVPRDPWAEYDLKTEEGVTLEVKSCAYLQSWHEETSPPSRIVFNVPKTQTWTLKDGYSGVKTHNADLYVLCLQTERDARRWNVLDLSQWRFHLLSPRQLLTFNTDSISLTRLLNVTPELTASAFHEAVHRAISRILSDRSIDQELTLG